MSNDFAPEWTVQAIRVSDNIVLRKSFSEAVMAYAFYDLLFEELTWDNEAVHDITMFEPTDYVEAYMPVRDITRKFFNNLPNCLEPDSADQLDEHIQQYINRIDELRT